MNNENFKPAKFPSGKENSEKLPVKAATDIKPRNALGDICGNALPNEVFSSQKKVKYSVLKKTTNVRPKSESGATETEVKYYFKSENLTQRNQKNEKGCSSEVVFVAGVDHYLSKKSEGTSESAETAAGKPMPPHQLQLVADVDIIKKPVQKNNLLRKICNRSRKIVLAEEDLYKNHLYSEEYFEDNYRFMLEQENNFVYKKDVLKQFVQENYRTIIVNWLTFTHQALRLTEPTFFITIRMFDYIIAACKLASNKYALIGIVCMWIAGKQSDVPFIEALKLSTLCSGKFSLTDILTAERQILRALNFRIQFPEPTTFLFYYLKREKLENNSEVRHSAMFLLEVFALLVDFSTLAPSVLAGLALHQVLVRYKMESSSFLEFIDGHLVPQDLFLRKSEKMAMRASCVLECKAASKEVVEKYSKEERCCVAKKFICN